MKKKFFLKNLVLFLIPLIFPLLIFGTLSIVFTQNNLKDDIKNNNITLLKQTKEYVELVLSMSDQLRLIYDANPDIGLEMDNILQRNSTTYEDNRVIKVLKGFLNAESSSKAYIHSINVYYDSSDPYFFSTSDGVANINHVTDKSWLERYRNADPNKRFWTETRDIINSSFEEKPLRVVSFYYRMYSRQGVIVINILPKYFNNILENITSLSDQSLIIMNENNQVFFSNSRLEYLKGVNFGELCESASVFFTISSANDSYIVSKLNSDRYGWKFLSIVPQQVLYKLPSKLGKLTAMLLWAAFIIGLSLTYYFTNKNYSQVSNIINILDSAENGKPLPTLPEKIKDEYSYIVHNILKTFIEHSYLKVSLSEKKFKMQTMELLALQSQISPHFLFNTLKTIYWSSIEAAGYQNEVSEMVENLSDILNYSLSSPKTLVPLAEEIRTTKSYTEIQKVRYKDKFDIIWDIDEDVEEIFVMKLFLQPIIENSIYHGIKEKEGKRLIKVKAFLLNSLLKISIIDNGTGINPETMKKIQEKLMHSDDSSDHIGLFNTDKRLKLNYGEEYGLKIRSKFGLGTVVFMYFPIIRQFN